MSDDRVNRGSLKVAAELDTLVAEQVLPGTGVDLGDFWSGFERLLAELGPRNVALLEKRETLQKTIDDWHLARKGQQFDAAEYKAFLTEIGYLVPDPAPFTIETDPVQPDFKVRDLQKAAGYRGSKPIDVRAVWLAPPFDRRKERFKTLSADVLRQDGEFRADQLSEFIRLTKESVAS